MFQKIFRRLFGSRNDRVLRRMRPIVDRINGLEPEYQVLSDDALRDKTAEFRQRLGDGATLDELLPEAFAAVREAARRVLGMRHFDVQLIGGMVLHQGKIAEMRTGEGKTLVATLAAYLNALPGKGVHVVTVNDYLARRDAGWMGKVYRALGLTVGVIVGGLDGAARREAYAADITYGTNNEFGFDYLRDNMAFSVEQRSQRALHYAIVDEVDSILIDEARTPLIISGPTDDNSALYVQMNRVLPELTRQEKEDGPGDFSVDEKARSVHLTEAGHERLEEILVRMGLIKEGDSPYSPHNITLMHHLYAALRAHTLFQRDVDYIVQNGEVVIVDEFTGRTMPGRRWSEGLHQAVEAKEGVRIHNENQTLASITFQNYFRLFDKLAGMTGTADTEAFEFQQIYGLEVLVIPTHHPMIRDDQGDLVYLGKDDKFEAIIEDIVDCVKRGQPVLVGTTSIEVSEFLANLLTQRQIAHQVLNAKQHEREAGVIAQAGRPGTVTIATNMAGRGTDIVLGGSLESALAAVPADDEAARRQARADWEARHAQVIAAGGLRVIGTERHESRRIDNQLRGRSGRQGDPGSSRFYLSLEDNLMRIFASERVSQLMQKLGMKAGEAIEHPWVTRAIENAQRKVEARNFDIRKTLLEYDNVANDQRRIIYGQRSLLLESEDIAGTVREIRHDVVNRLIDPYVPPRSIEEEWNIPGLMEAIEHSLGAKLDIKGWLDADAELHEEPLRRRIEAELVARYEEKEQQVGAGAMRHFEKAVMLQILDQLWKDHLAAMDYLRQGIHLRGYAQRDPKQEYKRESFEMFQSLLERIKSDVVGMISTVQVRTADEVARLENEQIARAGQRRMQYEHAEGTASAIPQPQSIEHGPMEVEGKGRKLGRNDPCPCGSGLKYKQCHGKLA